MSDTETTVVDIINQFMEKRVAGKSMEQWLYMDMNENMRKAVGKTRAEVAGKLQNMAEYDAIANDTTPPKDESLELLAEKHIDQSEHRSNKPYMRRLRFQHNTMKNHQDCLAFLQSELLPTLKALRGGEKPTRSDYFAILEARQMGEDLYKPYVDLRGPDESQHADIFDDAMEHFFNQLLKKIGSQLGMSDHLNAPGNQRF